MTEKATDKAKRGPKKGQPRKTYSSLTKQDIIDIVQRAKTETVNWETLEKDYKLSSQMAMKTLNIISRTRWKPIDKEKVEVPEGYFIPKNIDQTIEAAFFDLGYMKPE